jgi:hypothetical protein
MTNPETLKQLLEEASEEVKNWPDWMKSPERLAEEVEEGSSEDAVSDAA